MLLRSQRRRGVSVLEAAFAYPLFLMFLIGLVVGALGVFRYQEVASLAREGARWASVHGYSYSLATGQTAATAADVYTNAISPGAVALDPNRLHYQVTWNPDNRQGSQVTVQVSYDWVPEAFFGGVTLTSTATAPMSY